ncbi:YuzL family protein [Bacillus mangrovi]|uniref:YuzL family protein n=1 Tax=Metabacillus mangrovi TaxID=1491830 RepID=A0A7X2V3H2_9BACI|nr:YuzL family protein [Metabacillus mangrovi]MTH52079.1 YuzL family protein [Metabacillus mangrovi]
MSSKKANPSKSQLGSPETEGQGTTNRENGKQQSSASRKAKNM